MQLLTKFFEEIFEQQYNDGKDRLAMQKIVYIAEQKGLSLGDFSFTWDKKGPYSVDLKFSIQDELSETNDQEVDIQALAAPLVEDIKEIIKENNQTSPLSRDDWLELVTSLHFISTKILFTKDKTKVTEYLLDKKPYFAENQQSIDKAWERTCVAQ